MSLEFLKTKINEILKNPVFINTLWMLLAKVFSLSIQAAYFIIIARALGSENYGLFVGVSSLTAILMPFAGLGAGDILIQYVSRDKSLFSLYWGNALLTGVFTSLVLTCLLTLFSPLIFGNKVTFLLLILVCIGDLLGLTIYDMAAKAFVGFGLVKKAAQLQVFLTGGKLLAALSLVVFFPKPDAVTWSFLYCFSTVIVAMLSILLVNRMVGLPQAELAKIKPQLMQGLYFSISVSSDNINASVDKTMLLSLSTPGPTGTYAAAYRFIDVGYAPIHALLAATYAKFFQEGATGISGSLKFAKKLLPIVFIYGIVAALGYVLLAPFLPSILGNEYPQAGEALCWLAPIPFLIGVQYMAADALTGAGFQKTRSAIQVICACLNIGINFFLIPIYSWKGAALATLISDSLKMICLWVLVIYLYKKEQKNHQ